MPALMTLVESMEDAGFDGAGILDSQMLSRDTFVVLGQAATEEHARVEHGAQDLRTGVGDRDEHPARWERCARGRAALEEAGRRWRTWSRSRSGHLSS